MSGPRRYRMTSRFDRLTGVRISICDGETVLLSGIMEYVGRSGVHSGDSILVYPLRTLTEKYRGLTAWYTEALAKALDAKGLINIQFIVYNDEVFVIEVNPRSNRTILYISKVQAFSLSVWRQM